MSLNLLRGAMNALAILLTLLGVFGLFFYLAWAWLIFTAALLVIISECIHWVSDDCGYSDTPCAPFSNPGVHTPAIGCTVHRDPPRRPVWDTDIFGAPE